MANKDYNFQYTPLTGRLPGNSFVKQTEQAINELAGIVNEGAAQVEVITNLANQANDNSEVALEKANEALETAGRVYITLPNLDDADDYYDSQLYYFANSHSANLPVEDTGFLEVKTNDTKTAAEQVFIADTTGLMYMRHGVITSEEVGSETVYSVIWETWSSELASQDYVQQEVNNEADRVDETFLPLSGGTLTGDVLGVTPPNGDNSKKLANTEFIQALASVLVPTGCVQAFAGSTTPNGWLLCDGSAVSRADYASLFSVIGTTYGAGDGSTTFNLPNLVDKFVEGSATSGTEKTAGLPDIQGSFDIRRQSADGNMISAYTGAFSSVGEVGINGYSSAGTAYDIPRQRNNFKASSYNSIYGNSNTVQPPALTMQYIIKY